MLRECVCVWMTRRLECGAKLRRNLERKCCHSKFYVFQHKYRKKFLQEKLLVSKIVSHFPRVFELFARNFHNSGLYEFLIKVSEIKFLWRKHSIKGYLSEKEKVGNTQKNCCAISFMEGKCIAQLGNIRIFNILGLMEK